MKRCVLCPLARPQSRPLPRQLVSTAICLDLDLPPLRLQPLLPSPNQRILRQRKNITTSRQMRPTTTPLPALVSIRLPVPTCIGLRRRVVQMAPMGTDESTPVGRGDIWMVKALWEVHRLHYLLKQLPLRSRPQTTRQVPSPEAAQLLLWRASVRSRKS